MLDTISTSTEYSTLVQGVFSSLNQAMYSLFSSVSYLLVGNGSHEPEAAIWRFITPAEVGSIQYTNTIPQQSIRLYTLFIQLTVAFCLWIHG